jgi:glutamyl/glutaminyl-tRNA synthetase
MMRDPSDPAQMLPAIRFNLLGDFVVFRSNGLPVYHFCVTVDDLLMPVTDVLRVGKHLTNTLRQMIVYENLGFPFFAARTCPSSSLPTAASSPSGTARRR